MRDTGLYIDDQTFDFPTAADFTVGDRLSHIADIRASYAQQLGNSTTLRLSIDGIYNSSATETVTLARQTNSIESTDDGFTARGFLGLDFNTGSGRGGIELGYSSDKQATVSGYIRWAM
ncbi:MAG: hypothetical protein AAF429_00375 [Pseudomonadota bacterium]